MHRTVLPLLHEFFSATGCGMWVLCVVLRSCEQLQGDKSLQVTRILRTGSLILSLLWLMFGQWDAEQLQSLSLAGTRKHPGILLGLGRTSPVLRGIRLTAAHCCISRVVYLMAV